MASARRARMMWQPSSRNRCPSTLPSSRTTLRFGDVFARQRAVAGLDRRTEWINRPIDDRSRVDLADQLAQREPPGRHLYCDRDLREDGIRCCSWPLLEQGLSVTPSSGRRQICAEQA